MLKFRSVQGNCRVGRLGVCVAMSVVALSSQLHGDPVVGEVFPFRQPDGTVVQVRVWGDEFYHVVESLDGHTLILDQTTKAACYARLSTDGNELLSTGVPVGSVQATDLDIPRHLRINPQSARRDYRQGCLG